jgi:hypothetical protein
VILLVSGPPASGSLGRGGCNQTEALRADFKLQRADCCYGAPGETATGSDPAAAHLGFGVAFNDLVFPIKDWEGLFALLQGLSDYPSTLPATTRWQYIAAAVNAASDHVYTQVEL